MEKQERSCAALSTALASILRKFPEKILLAKHKGEWLHERVGGFIREEITSV